VKQGTFVCLHSTQTMLSFLLLILGFVHIIYK